MNETIQNLFDLLKDGKYFSINYNISCIGDGMVDLVHLKAYFSHQNV
jgi:hypothetical protein